MNIGDLTVKVTVDWSGLVRDLRAIARDMNLAADRIEREAAEDAPAKPPATPWLPGMPTYPPGVRVTSGPNSAARLRDHDRAHEADLPTSNGE